MPVITQITPQVKKQGYYNIYVDGKYSLSLSDLDLSVADIKINQNIDEKKLEELRQAQSRSKSYNFALRYLALRPRSISEVREYLLYRKNFESKDVEYSIEKLIGENYLNDYEFAEMWVRNRMLLSPKSDKVLRLELIKKGIDRAIIDEVIGSLDDEQKLNAIQGVIDKKFRQSKFKDKQKMTEYLIRQGYPYSLIKTAIEDLAFFKN